LNNIENNYNNNVDILKIRDFKMPNKIPPIAKQPKPLPQITGTLPQITETLPQESVTPPLPLPQKTVAFPTNNLTSELLQQQNENLKQQNIILNNLFLNMISLKELESKSGIFSTLTPPIDTALADSTPHLQSNLNTIRSVTNPIPSTPITSKTDEGT
jgi:hypothetical protein